jgi:hypothetical protein
MNIRLALILALLPALTSLTSCANQTPLASREIFDEQTARTLRVAATPLVFARDRSDVAAHARDYATLVAVEEDRSGEYRLCLLLYRWSTVDRRMSPPPDPEAGALRILADGRPIDLVPLDRIPISLTQREAYHVPNHADVVPRAYPVDSKLLHFIAASSELTLRMPQEALDSPFALWKDGRGALASFLESTAP